MAEKEFSYPKGIKWTKQRKDVYHILKKASEPLSAAEIYCEILKNHAEAPYAISTIYRILATFEEQGFVEKSNFMGDDMLKYEWKKEEHTHYAVCLNCHKKVPVHVCPLEHGRHGHDEENHNPWQEIAEEDDFLVTFHKLELYGYCRECEKNVKNFKKI